jgi:acyl carrier protein
MNDHPLDEELRGLLAEALRRDASRLGPDDDLVEVLGIDSLGALRLLALVELRYGVRFPDQRLKEFRSLGAIRDFIAGSRRGEGGV